MEQKSLFRKESLDRMSSPEKLNDYIKVSSPASWMLLVSLAALMISAIVWGAVGTLPISVAAVGVTTRDNEVTCYMDATQARQDYVGCEARVAMMLDQDQAFTGKVTRISAMPLSSVEAAQQIQSDWLAANLISAPYVYAVTIAPDQDVDLPESALTQVSIVTSEVRPLELILHG